MMPWGPIKTEAIKIEKEDFIHWARVSVVFIVFGIIGLLTSLNYSGWKSFDSFDIVNPLTFGGDEKKNSDLNIFPLSTQKPNEVVVITVNQSYSKEHGVSNPRKAYVLKDNSWIFVEGEVLDSKKEYLFGFGKELWSESGAEYEDADEDGEGGWTEWRESETNYDMKITFPEPGQYYVRLKCEGADIPISLPITIGKCKGSPIPHLVFSLFCFAMAAFCLVYIYRDGVREGIMKMLHND